MGTYSEQNAVDRVWFLLRDYGTTTAEQLLNDTEIKTIGLRGAEQHYSRIRPREVVDDLNGDGSAYLTLPAGYLEGLSTIVSIEYPIGSVPKEIMDPREYQIVLSAAGALQVMYLATRPAAGTDNVRLIYTAGRVIAASAANTTVLDPDFVAFCDLAASMCAEAIAAKYARTSEPAFNADVVNYRTRQQEWRDIAKGLWQRWERGMGIGAADGGSAPATSAYANWDLRAGWGGSNLNHPRLLR